MVSNEEENFLRIVYLNYRVATGALTRFFDKLHPNLSADLHKPGVEASLKLLYKPPPRKKRVLYQGQWDILYPPPGSATVTSADLDLTLMVCLLRNMHPVVTSPINGFDKLPLAHEISNGANIARLKYYKNFIISHSKYGTISNVDFSRIWIDLEQAITTLDNSAATAASLKVAKTHTLDSGMAKLLSTQNILDTKVSYLQEQFVIYTDNKRKENEKLKQLIEDQKAEMKKTSVNFDFEVKERKGKEDSISKRLNLGETALFEYKERVRALGKDLEEFLYFQQLLSSEFNKMETIVKESKEEKETSEKQIQSLCCQVNAYICKHKERMNAFETKSEMFDEILLNVQKDVDILKLESESVRIQTTCVSKRVEDLDVIIQTLDEDHIPKHIRAQHNNEIKYWETDDTYFLETRATHHILSSLPFNTCIVVTGSSGCGKSANIHHAALHLRDRFKYEIIPIMKPSEIMSYHNDKKNQVFVIDDICGKDTINKQTIQKWRDYSDKIETIFKIAEQDKEIENGNTVSRLSGPKLLISCRLHIFKDSQFQSVTLLNKKTFNLLSTELCLLQEERMVMLHKYIKDDINDNIVEVMDKVDYFPLLCKLSKNKSSEEVRKLLTAPVDSIKKTINIIIAENEKQFCVLVLCILFDDGFNTNWLEVESVPAEKKYKLEEIVKEFGIDLSKQLSRKILKSSFDTLTDTYLKRIGTEYRMIHDKIYVMAATICGQLLTQSFIRYAPYVFIRDYFIFESLKEVQKNDQWIILTKDEEGDYFERLLSDLRKFVITSTFHNKQLKYKSFIDKLIRYFGSSIETKALLKKLDIEGCKVEYDDGEYIDYIFTTPLIESVSYGFFDIAQFLIDECNCNVNKKNKQCMSALYMASEGGHIDTVKLLLNNKADVSQCNDNGESPLFVACKGGHKAIVEFLLQNKANVSQCNVYGNSPLSVACEGGHTDIVNLLLHNNANISLCNKDREPPLNIACEGGHTHIVRALLQNHANVSLCNLDGKSPLYLACTCGHTEVVKLLLQNNADVHHFNETPLLYVASQKGYTEVIKLFLKNKVQMSQLNSSGQSLLYAACEGGATDTVDLLLKNNADVTQCNDDDESPLYVACEWGFTVIVKLLLQNNADLLHNNIFGKSPLCIACEKGHTDTVKLLLENKANVYKCNSIRMSPLHMACREGHTDSVKLLLQYNADISCCNMFEQSSLYLACERGHTDTVKLLLQKGADVAQCGSYNQSPLFVACEGGHTDTVQLLLNNNADMNQCNSKGRSPLEVAENGRHTYTVKVLLQNNA